ncbi:MAG: acyl carrier protein [Lachnospiraceae bacterium]|nr:acyl carrier protein [Lachnospiraceae bacterium]
MEFEKIQSIIAETLGVEPEDITEETSFEELDADSLDLFEIITQLEEELGIEIPTEEADKIKTVGDAVEQIQKNVQ